MRCVNCQFANMPGVTRCGRCGSTLEMGSLAVDVHPPRATPWAKRLRRWFPVFSPALSRARNAGADVYRRVGRGVAGSAEGLSLTPGMAALLLVPGAMLFRLGRRTLGRAFLGAYLGFLAAGLVFLGTYFGSACLGLVFSVHLSYCLTVFRCLGLRPGTWFGVGLLTGVLLFGTIYLPGGWLLTNVAGPVVVDYDNPPFRDGDVVLVNRLAYRREPPRPGDVVLYDQRAAYLGQVPRAGNDHVNVRVEAGQRIDRVLAGPGDQVRWASGQLWVNGQPSPLLPLNPGHCDYTLEITVPPGCYFILPSTGRETLRGVAQNMGRDLSLVPVTAIEGRVYFRNQPLSRWGQVR